MAYSYRHKAQVGLIIVLILLAAAASGDVAIAWVRAPMQLP